jgi:hypothetical protein
VSLNNFTQFQAKSGNMKVNGFCLEIEMQFEIPQNQILHLFFVFSLSVKSQKMTNLFIQIERKKCVCDCGRDRKRERECV